jgi:phenylacetate-CoA ligase
MNDYSPVFTSPRQIAEHQLKGLQWTLNHVYNNNAAYRRRLKQAGVRPQQIRSLDDLKRLPFTTPDDLRNEYPFPFLSVPMSEVVRIHASSGTTGKRKIMTYTAKDVEDWAIMFARCYQMAGLNRNDRVQIAVGYGVWTAGVGFQLGCEKFGAMAVPVGPGSLDMQCQFLEDFQATVLGCTASMGLLLAEEISRRGLTDKLSLQKVIYGSERSSEAMRSRIRKSLGGVELFDIPGLTELYGPGSGIECQAHQGMHYWADYYILEIINPSSGEAAAPGEIGEMVVTSLVKQASPLVRYRTHDLTRLIEEPCPCGSILPRHDRLLGRSDDAIKYRAVNVYPSQLDEVLSQEAAINSEYQIIMERRNDGREYMVVRVERAEDTPAGADKDIAARLIKAIKAKILVSAEVELVDYASLPRTERKTQRVFDKRFL